MTPGGPGNWRCRPGHPGEGLFIGSTSTRVESRLIPRDIPDPPRWGVILETTPLTSAARDVFTAEELEVRILAHAERVARECPRTQRR